MDRYRDLYRAPISARYYPSSYYLPASYALSADPYLSAYSRVPSDAYAAYQPELLRFHRPTAPPLSPLSPWRRGSARRRPFAQTSGKRRPPHVQNLAPKKTSFKQTRKGFPVETSFLKKGTQVRALQNKPSQKGGKAEGTLATSLAKEAQELHSLYRTGVDPSPGKKSVKTSAKRAAETPVKQATPNARGQKRKADTPKKDKARAKKWKGRKKQKPAKKQQQEEKKSEKLLAPTPRAVKVEPPPLTEEEAEGFLALQNAACKAVGEFLGIPVKLEEADKSDAPTATVDEAKLADAQPNSDGEVPTRVDVTTQPAAALSPEEDKELEEEGFKFFSKFLDESQDLRNLYLEKKDGGAFECLVCRSTDPETSKKFTTMTNLLMHTSMRKLKRPEHRGYGRAICNVLGWELPKAPKQPAKQVIPKGDITKEAEVEEAPEAGKPGES